MNELLTVDELVAVERYEAAIAGTDFVERWVRYGCSRSDAPVAFHRAAALVLVATAVYRHCWLDFQHKRVYPSVYFLCLAGSGQRKSTALRYAEEAACTAFKDRVLSNDFTPEALISDLGTRTPSRGVAFVDEAGRMLGTMRQKSYGEGLKDLLSRLWDAPDQYGRKLQSGPCNLSDVFVNLLMATTTERLTELLTPEDVQSGFLARFVPVIGGAVTRRPLAVLQDRTGAEEAQLAADLTAMANQLESAPGPFPITPRALARLDRAEDDLESWSAKDFHADLTQPWCRKLNEHGARLGLLNAVSEDHPVVGLLQVLRALRDIDQAKDQASRLAEALRFNRDAKDTEHLYRFIAANPGVSRRDVLRKTGWNKGRVEDLAGNLEDQGRGGSRGPRTARARSTIRRPAMPAALSLCHLSPLSLRWREPPCRWLPMVERAPCPNRSLLVTR